MRYLFLLIAVSGSLAPLSGQSYEHVTITSAGLAPSFTPLGSFIETQYGMNDTLVTVDQICAGFPGRDDPEKVRSFIRYAYQNWGTTHVLLGGGAEVVPCRQVWARCWWAGVTLLMPTNLYYSDLDGDWDADGNGVFGEMADSVDLYPDVFVGRLPASDADGADLMVAKFQSYCSDSTAPYLSNVLLTGFDIDDSTFSYSTAEFYEANIVPAALQPCNRVYDFHTGNHKTAILDYLNAGQHIFLHQDHSDWTVIGAGMRRHGLGIYNDELRNLNNGTNYSIMLMTMGCFCGCFDSSDCPIVSALEAPNGGAVAGMANARYGLYGRDAGQNPQRTLSALQGERFLQALFDGGPASLEKFAQMQASLVPLADTSEPDRWCIYNLNLFGEPRMPVWVPIQTGVAEPSRPRGQTAPASWPSHVTRSLFLRGRGRLILTDALGRSVMQLAPGVNNLADVPAGVYFLRTDGPSRRFAGRIVKVSEE